MHSDETIQDLIAKYVSGEASPEEAIEVETWAEESLANKTHLEGCFRIYLSSDDGFNLQSKTQVWKNIESYITPITKAPTMTKHFWPVGIAASVLMVVVIAFLLTNQSGRNSFPLIYTTSTDTKKIRLSDGTEIILAPSSKVVLEKNYGDTSRRLTLQGSASFVVQHIEAKPFVVEIYGLRIKDFGTRFTVTNLPDLEQINVAVQEGVVLLLNSRGQFLTLQAGEKARYSRSLGNLAAVQTRKTNVPEVDEKERLPIQGPQKGSPVIDIQPLSDTIKTNNDSLMILLIAEAQKILGGPVRVTNNDRNKNDGLVKLTRRYRLLSDASIILYSELEYFRDPVAAHKAYERYRLKYPAAKDAQTLKPAAEEAFAVTEGSTYYLVVVRKQDVVLQARINKPPSPVSTQTLLQILKDKAKRIK